MAETGVGSGARGLRDREGDVVGTAFTVDMNALFERFVEAIVREEGRRAGLWLVPQAPRRLTERIPIRPDLVLRAEDRDLAVADAKYKELKPDGWPNADLYQMLAYCESLGLPSGLLIYASDHPYEEHLVKHAGVRLGIIGVDMNRSPRDLDASVRRAATRFVREAAARRSRPTMAV